MCPQYFFVILTCFVYTQAFDYRVPYCRFRCGGPCDKYEVSNPVSGNLPDAFYWRDFYGITPPDAYPIGQSNQYPQTYIGLVYDPSNNGTYVTTIYDGLNYVYTVRDNKTTKINETIQILCTSLPRQLSWVELTEDNVNEVASSHEIVMGGKYMKPDGDSIYPYIVKTDKDQIALVGFSHKLNTDVEFALMDGSYKTTEEYLWLVYKKEEEEKSPAATTSKPWNRFFSHRYQYQRQPNSFIPKFRTEIRVGSCSVCCSNMDSGKTKGIKNDERLATSMAYFWKPHTVIDETQAFIAGHKRRNQSVYVGQAYVPTNVWDVGNSDSLKSVMVQGDNGRYLFVELFFYQILSSTSPEKLKWVKTSVENFSSLDKNKLIYGGALSNGTKTYVCRDASDEENTYVGTARVLETGTYCSILLGDSPNYEVLMFDPE